MHVWRPRFLPDIGRTVSTVEKRSCPPGDPEDASAHKADAEVFTSSPEIARFDNMVCRLFNEDYDPPVIYVWVGQQFYCFSIFYPIPIPEDYTAPEAVAQKIRNWLATVVPGAGRTVEDLAADQWLHIRNKRPVEPVPTPDELRAMERPAKRSRRARQRDRYYAIKRIEVRSSYHLKVWFENGDVKMVDIKAMRGDSPAFHSIWNAFDKVKTSTHFVSWPVEYPSGPNIIEIKDEDIWGAGVDADD